MSRHVILTVDIQEPFLVGELYQNVPSVIHSCPRAHALPDSTGGADCGG